MYVDIHGDMTLPETYDLSRWVAPSYHFDSIAAHLELIKTNRLFA